MNNSDAQKEMDRETIKDDLQKISKMMVRFLGTCPHGEGAPFLSQGTGNPAPRYPVHAAPLTQSLAPFPDSLSHPRIRLPVLPLLRPGPASLPNLPLPDPLAQMMPPEFGDLLMEEYIGDSEDPQTLRIQFHEILGDCIFVIPALQVAKLQCEYICTKARLARGPLRAAGAR